MDTAFKVAARLVMALAASASGVMVQPQTHAQAQPEAHEKPPCDCAELTEAKARLEGQAKRLNDWPDLARYREANAKVAAPERRAACSVHGRLDHGPVGATAIRRIFSRETVHRAGN